MHQSNFISKIISGWKIILMFLLIAVLFAVKYNYFTAKEYCASAQVKTIAGQTGFSNGTAGDYFAMLLPKGESTDGALAHAVNEASRKQKVYVEYFHVEPFYKKELYTFSPIAVTCTVKDENFYTAAFDFACSGGNNFSLKYACKGIIRERTGTFGEEIHEKGINFIVNKNNSAIEKGASFEGKNLQFTISSARAFADQLLNTSTSSGSNGGIMTVSVKSTVPEKAMLLANAISENYSAPQSDNLNTINEELDKVAVELDKAQRTIAEYKVQNCIVDLPLQTGSELKHLENLETEKNSLALQKVALDNLSDYLRKNRVDGNASPEYGTVIDPVFSVYITKLNEKLAEQNSRTDSSSAGVAMEINFLKNTIAEGIRNTRKKIALQEDHLTGQIAEVKKAFLLLPGKESDLESLARNLQIIEKKYNYLLDKRTEALYSQLSPVGSVIRKATIPQMPVNTEGGMVWLLALIFGLLSGVIAVIFGRKRKQKITDRKVIDVQHVIPYFAALENRNKKALAEQFNTICTKILVTATVGEKTVITVSSSASGEGKTFTATGIAKSLAALDLKVLLVDMNLTAPALQEQFDARISYTLADIFENKKELQEAVAITSIPNLDLLVGGIFSNGINSLIATNRLSKVLTELKKHYDFIIIDVENTMESVNAIPLIKAGDLNLYVVKNGSDAASIFDHAEQLKDDYKLNNLFYILNNGFAMGSNTRRQENKQTARGQETQNADKQKSKISLMQKAALWFY